MIGIYNPQLVIIPMVHLKDKAEAGQILVTLISLSHDVIQVSKHA